LDRFAIVIACLAAGVGCRADEAAPAPAPCIEEARRAEETFLAHVAAIERRCPPDQVQYISDVDEATGRGQQVGGGRPLPIDTPRTGYLGMVFHDFGPDRMAVATTVVDSYRAVSCEVADHRAYDAEHPAASPMQMRLTSYHIQVAPENRTLSRAEAVVVYAEARQATKERMLAFLVDDVFAVLDPGDRRVVGRVLVENLRASGHLAPEDERRLVPEAGRLREASPPRAAGPSWVHVFESEWIEGEKSPEPLWTLLVAVEMRFPTPCAQPPDGGGGSPPAPTAPIR
jgi:hypothetical protein